MPDRKHLAILWKCLIAAIILVAIWAFVRFALQLLLPFIIALLLARLMETPIRLLHERFNLPRGVSAALLTLAFVGLLAALGVAVVNTLISELNRLLSALPDLMTRLPDITGAWQNRVDIWIAAAPIPMQDFLRSALERFFTESASIPGDIYTWARSLAAALATGLPRAVLFFFTMILSTFLISCEYKKLTIMMMKPFSKNIRQRILRVKEHLTHTAGRWLKAQALLICITFLTLLMGLLLLREPYALLIALVTALLDALPVIGIGLVLLPWAVYCLLSGAVTRGVLLLLLYAVITLVRGMLEPRLVGRQIGLPPLLTLMSMYVGFSVWGVIGMILMPFAAMLFKQMIEWGWIFPQKKENMQPNP